MPPPLSVEAFDALLLMGRRDVRRVSVGVETKLGGEEGERSEFLTCESRPLVHDAACLTCCG